MQKGLFEFTMEDVGTDANEGIYHLRDIEKVDFAGMTYTLVLGDDNNISSANDILIGGDGDDQLTGDLGTNNGTLTTVGNDTLMGGAGNDTLVGDVFSNFGTFTNAGSDTFVFDLSDTMGIGMDEILDFGSKEVDPLIFDKLEFRGVGMLIWTCL